MKLFLIMNRKNVDRFFINKLLKEKEKRKKTFIHSINFQQYRIKYFILLNSIKIPLNIY